MTAHKHTPLTALFREYHVTSTRKIKPIWILLKQETVSGSGISWAISKSAPHSSQTTTPAPHHSVFTVWMPTNSVKALKTIKAQKAWQINQTTKLLLLHVHYKNSIIIEIKCFVVLQLTLVDITMQIKLCKTMKRQKKENFEQSKNSHTGRDKEYLPMVRDIL